MLVGARILFALATPLGSSQTAVSAVDLLLTALFLVALAWVALDLIERRRVARPHPLLLEGSQALKRIAAVYATVGAIDAVLLWIYEGYLRNLVSRATLDLLYFSLHPFQPVRLGAVFGLVLLHAGVIWTAAIVIRLAKVFWRRPISTRFTTVVAVSWIAGAAAAVGLARFISGPTPLLPLVAALAAVGLCAAALEIPRPCPPGVTKPRGSVRCCWRCSCRRSRYPALYAFTTERRTPHCIGFDPRRHDSARIRGAAPADPLQQIDAVVAPGLRRTSTARR